MLNTQLNDHLMILNLLIFEYSTVDRQNNDLRTATIYFQVAH